MKYKAEEEELKRLARDVEKDHNAELKEEAKAKQKVLHFPHPRPSTLHPGLKAELEAGVSAKVEARTLLDEAPHPHVCSAVRLLKYELSGLFSLSRMSRVPRSK